MELLSPKVPRLREIALVAAVFTAVTAFVMWPLFGVMADHFPIAASDSKLNAWVLAWGADRLPYGLDGFWTPPIFYPYLNTLAYSENLLGVAVIVAPVQWIFGNPTLTYNIAFLLSFVVAGTTAYLLALTVTGSRSAALIAGLGFAFTPYRWAQLTHLHVLWSAWLPLVLWALHGALRTHRWSFWLVCVAAVLLQVSSSGYSAFQVAMACGLVGLAGAIRYGVSAVALRRMALAGLAAAVLLSSTVVAYYHVWVAREPTPGDLVAYSADLGTYMNVHPALPAARWLSAVAQDEGHLFPGFVILSLAAVALVPMGGRRLVTRWRWAYLALAVAAVLASLGPEPRAWGHALPIPKVYEWLAVHLPLFDAMRVPARFGVVAILAFTVLAAIGAARATRGISRRPLVIVTALVGAIIVWEGYGGPLPVMTNALASGAGDDAAYEWLIGQPTGPVLVLPMATLGGRFTMHQQYGALKHRHPVVDGVGRADTPLVQWLSGSASPLVVPEELPRAVSFLRGLGVRYVMMRRHSFRDPGIEARLYDVFEADAALVERGRFENVVIWEIDPGPVATPVEQVLTGIPSEAISLSASENADRILLAMDGNASSRWVSRSQDGSEWVAIDFDRPRNLARIDFVMHPRSDIHYPRLLEIVATGRGGGGAETVLFAGSLLPQLGRGWKVSPERPVASLDLPSYVTSRVLIRQRGRANLWWAIDELRLWERQ